MTIALPKGYTPPENARPGESFEAVATLKINEDGSYELAAIDGMDLGGGETPPAAEEQDPRSKFAAKIPLPWDQETEY